MVMKACTLSVKKSGSLKLVKQINKCKELVGLIWSPRMYLIYILWFCKLTVKMYVKCQIGPEGILYVWTNIINLKTGRCSCVSTCSEVDHGGGACCDSIHLGMDLMFGLIHLVFAPGLGCLEQGRKKNYFPLVTWQRSRIHFSALISYQYFNESTE